MLPLANKFVEALGQQAAAVHALVAARQVGAGLKQLWADKLEFAVVVVEKCVDLEFCRAAHGNELTSIPETRKLIWKKKKTVNNNTVINGNTMVMMEF